MKRFSFLTAITGIGVIRAQTCDMPRKLTGCLLRNGECPVCGTMAEPYKRPTGIHAADCGPNSLMACFSDGPYGPTERITRCRRCNAAFWQDSVEPSR